MVAGTTVTTGARTIVIVPVAVFTHPKLFPVTVYVVVVAGESVKVAVVVALDQM
jgi:hypothetical protein